MRQAGKQMSDSTARRTSRSTARSTTQIAHARELRQTATEAEQVAWQLLRKLRPAGFSFRRQHPVGRCVVDFCCPLKRLILELDGSVHGQQSQARRDVTRTLSGLDTRCSASLTALC